MSMKFATYWAVVQALFRLRALNPTRRKATKQVIDASTLSEGTVRKALNNLELAGLVGRHPSTLKQLAFWIGRKVKGKRTTSYKSQQYLSDAAHVQSLTQSDANARALLGSTNLGKLNMKDKTDRALFNAIVKALTQAGHRALPSYGIVTGSFYWWLKTKSRAAAASIIQKFKVTG